MRTKKDTISRISKEFDDMLKKTANAKIVNGTAKLNERGTFSTRRLTLAMARHRDMKKMLKDIELAKFEGDEPSRW
jgi:hypothetical protein|tara:strand:- start:577 stop:804 length:228 start_codon:yes stop_codon:yes gene_type:complete